MYPFGRFLRVMARARRAARLAPGEGGEIEILCYPWDLDVFMELNNGRALTLYDLGRFDLAARAGLMAVLRREGWQFAVAGASVRFRHRVRAFDRITLRTAVVGVDGRWIYMAQSMTVRGRPVSSLLARTAVTAPDGAVAADRVMAALGAGDWRPDLPDWVAAWAAADAQRPWPPG